MQIQKKFIGNDQIDDTKILLNNNTAIRSRNAANSADINIIKLNASDLPDFGGLVVNNVGNGVAASDVAAFGQIGSAVANYLPLAGGTMTGGLNMNSQQITGLPAPTVNGEALRFDELGAANGIATLDGTSHIPVAQISLALNNLSDLNVAAPTNGQVVTWDSGTSKWIAASPGSAPLNNKEVFVLSSTDITNQYIDLAHVARNNSVDFVVDHLVMYEGAPAGTDDYSVAYTGGAGGNTRLTFEGDLKTGGVSALVAGDIVHVNYLY